MSRAANRPRLRTAFYGWALAGSAIAGAAGFAGALAWTTLLPPPPAPDPAALVAEALGPALLELDARRLADSLDRFSEGRFGPDPAATALEAAGLRARALALLGAEARAQRLSPSDLEAFARLASDLGEGGLDLDALRAGAPSEIARLGVALRANLPALAALAETARAAPLAVPPAPPHPALSPIALAGALCCVLMLSASARAVVLSRRARDVSRFRQAQPIAPADPAAQDRTRILALLSHELRTPLNGVLGLMALVRDMGVSEEQSQLLDQAERSGRQLTDMLDDVLDGEQEGEAGVDVEAFRLDAIAQSMRDLFGPAAARAGVGFTVETIGAPPPLATGDGRRFQRALSHLCSFVLDRAGARDVKLEIGHDGAECRAALSFDLADPEAGAAELRRIVAAEPAVTQELGEAGLGPLLAKGLLERIGGRLEVSTTESGRVLVLAATPSSAADAVAHGPRVRIMAQTRSLGALGAAAASAAGVEVLDADDAPAPDIVLVEAGGEEEAVTVAEARGRWSRAMLLALGTPTDRAAFDGIVAAPLDPDRVARAVESAWAERDTPARTRPAPPPASVARETAFDLHAN